MKLFKKPNQTGFAHFAVLAVIVVALAAVGTYMLVKSHADTTTYSCPKGGTLSGTTCSYPATYNAGSSSTYASLCNSGDSSSTYNWNGTTGYHCAHLVSSVGLYGTCPAGEYKAYTYCYTIYRPYCNSGDTISSDYSTCTHTVVAGYSCPLGGSLSGSTCYYAATATTTTTTSPPPPSTTTYPYEDSSDASADLNHINNYRSNHGWSALSDASCLDTIASNWAKTRAAANSLLDPSNSWITNQLNTVCGSHQSTLTAYGVNTGQTSINDDTVVFDAFVKSCEHIQNIADHGPVGSKFNVGPCTDANQKYHSTYNVSSSGYNHVGTGAWVGSGTGQGPWMFICQIYARW